MLRNKAAQILFDKLVGYNYELYKQSNAHTTTYSVVFKVTDGIRAGVEFNYILNKDEYDELLKELEEERKLNKAYGDKEV